MKAALGNIPLTTLRAIAAVHDQGDGTSTLIQLDGQVISCNPGGTLERRPSGTAGPWERCVVAGSLATFCPDGITAYSFSFAAAVPN